MAKIYQTPGVYIEEKSAFPHSAVPVPTAIPAFVGYTEKAVRDKKDLTHVPTKITSYSEALTFFGGPPQTTFSLKADAQEFFKLTTKDKRFLLHLSLKMFFVNGGTNCYIVSVGDYNNGVKLEDFSGEYTDATTQNKKLKGISSLLKEAEPTMLVIPDAVLLPEEDCRSLQNLMIKHCGTDMRSRFAILDIYEGFKPRTNDDQDVINRFRNGLDNTGLDFAAAYYPWLHTSVTPETDINFTCLEKEGNSHAILQQLLLAEVAEYKKQGLSEEKADARETVIKKLESIKPDTDDKEIISLHQTLLAISPLYKEIIKAIQSKLNLLPPSAAMAGVYSMVDNSVGVQQSPANVSVGSVIKPVVPISDAEQEDLNLPLNGKAVNAIRTFPGKGTLVWGARTLDGNSQDWRYISVRRTVIFIEQSIKYAIEPYVFEPNAQATWSNLKALITNFLTNVWHQGALVGSTPESAFDVQVGLGTTMTPADIQDGYIRISVKLAVTRPAEFIVLTFQQKMQQS